MNIDDDHLYHGAALIQIAEDPQFTAINSFDLKDGVSRSAYRINTKIGVFLKYCTKPNDSHKEYTFTFHEEHLDELSEIAKDARKVFVVLVCVKARQVCCLPYAELLDLVEARKEAKGAAEAQYKLLVTLPKGKSFRVYMDKPGARNTMIRDPLIISRTAFPSTIFE